MCTRSGRLKQKDFHFIHSGSRILERDLDVSRCQFMDLNGYRFRP
jgi:hypothetical protein